MQCIIKILRVFTEGDSTSNKLSVVFQFFSQLLGIIDGDTACGRCVDIIMWTNGEPQSSISSVQLPPLPNHLQKLPLTQSPKSARLCRIVRMLVIKSFTPLHIRLFVKKKKKKRVYLLDSCFFCKQNNLQGKISITPSGPIAQSISSGCFLHKKI